VSYVAGLDLSGAPADTLFRLLAELNGVERLTDGSVPFAIFLGNAEASPAASKDQEHAIQRALQGVSARMAGVRAPPLAATTPSRLERAKDDLRSDMLPFSFLATGARMGRSVARIQVPCFMDGKPVTLADGTPKRDVGTGWLLSADLIITNHHVINVRDDDRIASASDLELQALGAVAQFDYESPDAKPVEVRIKAIEAFAPLDGPLDYAILRLASPQPDRPPLRLRRAAMALPDDVDDYPSLNIIQHPQGGPKMVAFRNNKIYRATDTDILYFTDTQRGSSGSPVLDDDWQVAALHKKWTFVPDVTFQGKTAGWVNVGTQIAAILADLASKPALRAEIG
jgi:endonuclease G